MSDVIVVKEGVKVIVAKNPAVKVVTVPMTGINDAPANTDHHVRTANSWEAMEALSDGMKAVIRSLVDAAADSNVFTDARLTKLNGIETGATADQTAAEILALLLTVDGAGTFLDADLLDGLEGAAYEKLVNKGAADGYTPLVGGLVPSQYLPSYVDDVLEYADFASFPATGEAGKIYIAQDTNLIYRWASTVYIEISDALSAAEVKSLYESNADTNAFTDALFTKLNGIEAGAAADQQASEVPVDTTSFNNNLTSAEDTVQKVAQKLNDMVIPGDGKLDSLSACMFPKDWETVHKQGWVHGGFNQQHGGAPWGGRLPDGTDGEVAACVLPFANSSLLGSTATNDGWSQPFKVLTSIAIEKLSLQLTKEGSPTDNVTVAIYSDVAGVPGTLITNGTADTISGKTISSDTQEVVFNFTTPPSLSSDTIYHIVINRSGAVDINNHYILKHNIDLLAPYPNATYIDTGTWTPIERHIAFKIIPTAATATIRDGKFHCYDTDQLGQIGYLTQPLKNFWSGDEFAGQFKVNAVPTASRPLAQAYYDNDNHMTFETDASSHAILRCNGSTITGTSVIALGDSLGWYYDGTNLHLTVNGVEEGTAIAVSFADDFDKGTFILGGAIPADLTWTKETDMSLLPSADGWTWTGTATEANAMSVSGGKLYQNSAGYGSTDTGNYKRTTTLSNATGWRLDMLVEITSSTDATVSGSSNIYIQDGAKQIQILLHSYFIEFYDSASLGFVQVDLTRKSAITVLGKGSDFYVFIDGKLAFDGSGLLSVASATNEIAFGDLSGSAGDNADVIWHYVNYIESFERPQATDTPIYDFGFWQKDASSLLPDVAVSTVKSVCGLKRDWIREIKRSVSKRKIGSATTTSTDFPATAIIPEMFAFIIGASIKTSFNGSFSVNAAGRRHAINIYTDGVGDVMSQHQQETSAAVDYDSNSGISAVSTAHGLHYCATAYRVTGDTLTLISAGMLTEAE